MGLLATPAVTTPAVTTPAVTTPAVTTTVPVVPVETVDATTVPVVPVVPVETVDTTTVPVEKVDTFEGFANLIPADTYTIYYDNNIYFIIVDDVRYNLQYAKDGSVTVVDGTNNSIIDSTKTQYINPTDSTVTSLVVYDESTTKKTELNNQTPIRKTYRIKQRISPSPSPSVVPTKLPVAEEVVVSSDSIYLYTGIGIGVFILLLIIIYFSTKKSID